MFNDKKRQIVIGTAPRVLSKSGLPELADVNAPQDLLERADIVIARTSDGKHHLVKHRLGVPDDFEIITA